MEGPQLDECSTNTLMRCTHRLPTAQQFLRATSLEYAPETSSGLELMSSVAHWAEQLDSLFNYRNADDACGYNTRASGSTADRTDPAAPYANTVSPDC